MPGSPSLVGRKPGIKSNIKLVAREGLEGSNPSPGADFLDFLCANLLFFVVFDIHFLFVRTLGSGFRTLEALTGHKL